MSNLDHQLCTMIEADIKHFLCSETGDSDLKLSERSSEWKGKGRLITFDRFLAEYWPHFPQPLSKRLC